MGSLAILAVLAAATPEPVRLVAPAYSVSGVEAAAARAWSDFLARQLSAAGLIIQTEVDITAALGAERQRQLLGCGNDSCVAEMVGALGSDGLLLGSVALAGETRVLNLRIVSRAGEPLASASVTAQTDAEVIDQLQPAARELVEQLRAKVAPGRIPDEGARLLKRQSLWPGLLGGLAGAAGITMVSIASGAESNIRQGTPVFASAAELDGAIDSGRKLELAGWVVMSVGFALALVAIAIVVFGEGR